MKLDLSEFGLDPAHVPDCEIPQRRVELSGVRRRKQRRFIPPVSIEWFDRACVLPGKALAVGLILWRLVKLKKTNTVVLTQAALDQRGISRWEKYAALRALEKAGLISVRARASRNPEITLLDLQASSG
jgi:hypothetical protein